MPARVRSASEPAPEPMPETVPAELAMFPAVLQATADRRAVLTCACRVRDPRLAAGVLVAGAALAVLGEVIYERRSAVHGSWRPALAWLGLLLALTTVVVGRTPSLNRGAARHAVSGGRRAALLGLPIGVALALVAGPPVASAVLLAVLLLLALTPMSRVAAGAVLGLPLPTAMRPRTLLDARALEVGLAAGLALGAGVASTLVRVVVLAAAAGLLVLLVRTPPPGATTALLLVAALAVLVPSARAGGHSVTVDGDRAFTSTGITVKAGELLTIDATGSVRFLGGDAKAVADPSGEPAGYQGCGGPGFCGSLVGRLAGGGVFLVGRHVSFTVTTPGELELGVNDFAVGDNTGSFHATVAVSAAAPGAAPVAAVNPFSGAPHDGGGIAGDVPGTSHRVAAGLGGGLGALLGLGLALSVRPVRSGVYEVGRQRDGGPVLVADGDRLALRTRAGDDVPVTALPATVRCDGGTVLVREGPVATFVPGEPVEGELVAGYALAVEST